MLRYVSSGTRFSIYLDRAGEEVYLLNGTMTRLLDEFDYEEALRWWNARPVITSVGAAEAEYEILRQRYTDLDMVNDEVSCCVLCYSLDLHDDMVTVEDGEEPGGLVCDDCRNNSRLIICESCSGYFRRVDVTDVDDCYYVCDADVNRYWSNCGDCEQWYRDAHGHDCPHYGDGCDCASPAQVFTMPNGGLSVGQDERVTVTMAAGIISQEGLSQIAALLRRHRLPAATDALFKIGAEWQTTKGNFTKRLSRETHKTVKNSSYWQTLSDVSQYPDDDGTPYYPPQGTIPPALLAEVGNIARDHSKSKDEIIAFTRDLNMDPEDFGHSGSCWWESYYEGRCSLKQNGGVGMRSFCEEGEVTGRAWVQPMKKEAGGFSPTFDTTHADAFVVFNGYGALSGYSAARLMAQMNGMTYRKVGFYCAPMFINGDSAYLVGAEEIVAAYTDSSLSLHQEAHSNLFHLEQHAALATKETASV